MRNLAIALLTLSFSAAAGAQADPAVALIPEALRDAPTGSVFEARPAALSIATELGRRVASHGGAAIVIDYGHDIPAPGETLQAVRRHGYADPLADPGAADLTAHVDFAALATAARQGGAAVHGPVPQGAFLRRLGIEQRAAVLKRGASSDQARDIDLALERLTAPDQMGVLFKVLAITHPGMDMPAGFER